MVTFDTNVRIVELQKSINEVKKSVDQILKVVKPEEDLWNSSEMTRKWKVSERTIASWRSKGIINFIKINGIIWYPREAREEFLCRNLIKVDNGR
jgi:hypothetical protein